MKTTEIVQNNNRLIAEFLGYRLSENDNDYDRVKHDANGECLEYHSDWNWLMQAVEKVYQTGISGGVMEDLQSALMSAEIGRVYYKVVAFIQWYNAKN